MKKRLLAAALTLALLLTGCGPTVSEPNLDEGEPSGETIAYVPLDDRPDNWERVIYLAESLGYELLLPEPDLFRTRLNDQPTNENGTQFGDRGALLQWVLDQEAAGCDRYVLFLDQLLSGGLVNSRAMSAHEAITLPDGSVVTEYEALDLLLDTLAADEDNRVWLLDSVMRLAPTVGYQHWTLEEYNALRSYGMAPRPDLDGDWTLEAVESLYPLNKDGSAVDFGALGLDEGEIDEYLSARSRKLELTDRVQRQLAEPGFEDFRLLIGIDDSSAEECIQKNEIALLRSRLRPGDALLSGVDDLAFKAVSKLFLEEVDWAGADVTVEYFGGTEDQAACAYDFQALETVVDDHLEFFRLREVDSLPDMGILVLTQPVDESQMERYIDDLVQRLLWYQKSEIPVTLIDAGNGRYGTAFHEELTKKTDLGWLLSYSGFLDMAIVTGTALSHGAGRLAFLQVGEQTRTTERAFARTLADSVLKDFAYKHIVRPQLLDYVRGQGGNPDNFWSPAQDVEDYTVQMAAAMNNATRPLIENFEHSSMISGLEPYALRSWGGVGLGKYGFPWDRAFEISMEISLGEFGE